jgi:hypothetical protein
VEESNSLGEIDGGVEGDHLTMFDGISVATLTPPALLGFAVLLVLLGRLVPWFQYNAKVKECEKWYKAWELERDARVASDAQRAELLELAKTTYAIIDAAFGSASARHHREESGDTYVGRVSWPTQKATRETNR